MLIATKRAARRALYLRDLIRSEHRNIKSIPVPLARRAVLWRRGFLGDADLLYDFSRNDWRLYLSDYAYYLKTPFINFGRKSVFLNDKLFFYYLMKGISALTPALYGVVEGQKVAWIDAPPSPAGSDALRVRGLLEQGHEIVLKPLNGGNGDGISFLSLDEGSIRVNGEQSDEARVGELLTPGTLISERVGQADYAARISESAINTLRVVTMWDYARDGPFIAFAVHRFGTARSAPVDNWGRGGLSALVDVETGELGPAAAAPYSGRLERHAAHPDSGAPIEGTVIPSWPKVKQEVLRMARSLPHLAYVGWDLVAGDDGPCIIEGNAYPNVHVIQVHRPLLADDRVRDFYRHHGVISG